MQDHDWDDLRILLAIGREASLAGAARRLGVNETTVGRRLARAEQRLGARLFERAGGRMLPTEAGDRLVEAAERMELAIQAATRAVAGTDALAAGLVRVTTVPLLAHYLLLPAMPALLTAHPGLRVELVADPRNLSLTRRDADIALRLARPNADSRAIARRIGRLHYGVYGPALTAAVDLPWLGYGEEMADLPQARWIAERVALESRDKQATGLAPVAVNDGEGLLQAVRTGLGRSLLPMAIADLIPGLARLDAGPPALSRELWILVHPDLRDLTRVRVVLDWLAELFREPD